MNKIYHVLVTYATRRLLMLIGFLITVAGVFLVCAAASGSLGNQSSDMRPVAVLFFPYGIFVSCMGIFLKQQFATSRASVVPGYRGPHLIVSALIIFFPLAVFGFTAAANSLPLNGILGWFAFAAVAGLYWGSGEYIIALSCFAVSLAAIVVPQFQAAIFEMLEGRQPGMAWSLSSAAAAATALLYHRLSILTEDDADFGNVMPLDPWDLRAATLRTQTRAVIQRRSSFSELIAGPASRRLDRITTRPATTLWQRVALIRLGVDAPVNISWLAFVMTFFATVMLIPTMSFDDPQQILRNLLMVAAIATIGLWTSAFSHSSRRGYESLRPQTRRKWVIENALAIALNIIFLQSVIICLNPFLIAAFLQGRISLPLILTASMSFVGGQVLSLGLFFWVASFNSRMWNVIAVAAMYGGLMSLSTEVLNPSPGGRQLLIALIACGTTSVTGIAFCGFAYRRWCRIDLE